MIGQERKAERETGRKYDGRRGRRNGNEREGRRVGLGGKMGEKVNRGEEG